MRIDEWVKEFIDDLKTISPKLTESLASSLAQLPAGTFRTNLRQRRRSSVIILPTAEDAAVAKAAEEFYSSGKSSPSATDRTIDYLIDRDD